MSALILIVGYAWIAVFVMLAIVGWLLHIRRVSARWRVLYWIVVALAVVALFNFFQSSH